MQKSIEANYVSNTRKVIPLSLFLFFLSLSLFFLLNAINIIARNIDTE